MLSNLSAYNKCIYLNVKQLMHIYRSQYKTKPIFTFKQKKTRVMKRLATEGEKFAFSKGCRTEKAMQENRNEKREKHKRGRILHKIVRFTFK